MARIFLSFMILAAGCLAQKPAVNFQREIRPILSDNFFACHGPDAQTRMAGLRLDTREGASKALASGRLLERINHEKPALRMPPPQTNKKLTAQQIDTMKRWIEQGAPWKEHWSFAQPMRPEPPAVRNTAWVRNPIDRFVVAKLEANGLKPGLDADRRTLARRVALDTRGLPPEPAEVEEFVNDKSPEAYEKYLDKMMSSSHWGEHRGRYWLDAARYADTHGIHVDNYREMWAYRDWVINAFNRNLPFDRFTIEQIAGDLLPNRTLDQQIATGFHRCNVTTNEAGLIEAEYAAIYAKDRVDTTGFVFLGLSVGCASCHDHKFDAISQKDFYAMTAFFKNTTQKVMDGNVPDTPPILVVPREEDRERWQSSRREVAAIRERMKEMRNAKSEAMERWLASEESRKADRPSDEGLKALAWDKPFSIAVSFLFPKAEDTLAVASQIDRKSNGQGWAIDIGARVPVLRLTGRDGKSITIRAAHLAQLTPGSRNQLLFTYDASKEQAGLSMYVNGEAVPTQGAGDQTTMLRRDFQSAVPLKLAPDAELRVYGKAVTEDEARLLALWETDRSQALPLYYLAHHDAEYQRSAAELTRLALEQRAIRKRGSVTHVMEERMDSKPMSNILFRGMYDQPREAVEPAVPAALPPMPASWPRNRLGLARWLVDASNPLTARVTVNRYWQEVFGTGLVKTAEDFGSQGEAPSHPELLDWLAVEFRESGWDIKKLFKLMLTSSAYRQSAQTSEEKLKRDPENRLLSRGPRFRLDGELVRDYALSASGLLSGAIGGPSVKPYQPENVWETVAMQGSNTRFYRRDDGDKIYRRSMYWFWKRSAPPASMEIFNAPTRESCTVRRERTNTPLQALVTMNDPQFVEASRRLARNALKESPSVDGQIDYMTARLLSRVFDARERAAAKRAYADYLKYYDSKPDDAWQLLSVGATPVESAVPPANWAALTMLANQLMNLDEVLNK